jgi:hypothetical protein
MHNLQSNDSIRMEAALAELRRAIALDKKRPSDNEIVIRWRTFGLQKRQKKT